jgi:hypothetical protein
MRARRRRVLVAIAAALGLGAATSVAVAWALALRPPRNWTDVTSVLHVPPQGDRTRPLSGYFNRAQGTGFDVVQIVVSVPGVLSSEETDLRGALDEMRKTGGLDAQSPPLIWPAWLPPLEPVEQLRYTRWTARITGWPMPCLKSRTYMCSDRPGTQEVGAIRLQPIPAPTTRIVDDPGAGSVPLIPLLPGMLVDAAVFAIPWMLILLAAPAARRAVRRRRGRCAECGYDLRATPADDPCPECGDRP